MARGTAGRLAMDEQAPLQPVPATAEALAHLGPEAEQVQPYLDELVGLVREQVPGLVALSLSLLRPNTTWTFTLAISDERLRGLDAVQYLQDGPCVRAVLDEEVIASRTSDNLSEEKWSLYARSCARFGVRSSLSVPIRLDGEVMGGLNMYADADDAFEGRVERVTSLLSAAPWEGVRDADLTFTALERATETLLHVEEMAVLDVAAGLLAAAEAISEAEASSRIMVAARRAGVPPIELAKLVIESAAEE
jgi:GAF domain-containing protein